MEYRLIIVERDGRWFAHAVQAETGDRFGVECASDSADEAAARLTQWLEWQREHVAALRALQHTQQACHRAIVVSAFAASTEGSTALELEQLARLEAARVQLDEVRARKPE